MSDDPQDWRAVLDGRRDWAVVRGDCMDLLAQLPAGAVDAVITDPPYGLGFMGKEWDHGVPGPAFWQAAGGAVKPGAHMLAFGGTRTFHRLTCAIEDAGWDIRDCVMWIYGSGFPKSHNVSVAIDKLAGAERPGDRTLRSANGRSLWSAGTMRCDLCGRSPGSQPGNCQCAPAPPATDAAREWAGWGTSLKPAWEPCIVARWPLAGTVAQNVLAHGTGAINVDACRVATGDALSNHGRNPTTNGYDPRMSGRQEQGQTQGQAIGRWPANLILSHSPECREVGTRRVKGSGQASGPTVGEREATAAMQAMRGKRGDAPFYTDADGLETVAAWECADGCPVAMMDAQSGVRKSGGGRRRPRLQTGGQVYNTPGTLGPHQYEMEANSGGASRFFKTFSPDAADLLLHRAKAIISAWNHDLANTADNSSPLSNEHVASVLSDAVTLASHGAIHLLEWTAHGTNATPTQLRILCESVIAMILSSGDGRLPAQSPDGRTPNSNHASDAATPRPTATTTTTTVRLTSAGFAVDVTLSTMPGNTEAGEAASRSRFRYCAKASRADRGEGNVHPTVKPQALMRYLVELITRPGAVVADPFAGSGSTGVACIRMGRRFIGCELDPVYWQIAVDRLTRADGARQLPMDLATVSA